MDGNAWVDSVVDIINVGTTPFGVAYNPSNDDMYVTNRDHSSNTVSVIDSSTNTVTDTIPVETQLHGIAYNQNNNDVYVDNRSLA